uniref:Uncharacterized protein n=1 Tax=viral metagenome TaxID=1070528 RepID=A0A6C0E8E0_9ZZZZ
MGNTSSTDCPKISKYIDDTLKPDERNLNNQINDLNAQINANQKSIDKYTKDNQELQTQISKMFTKAQLDTDVSNAIKPLQDQINSNNNTISALTADKNRLTGIRDNLLKQLGQERNIVDQSLPLVKNEINSSTYKTSNMVYDSNEKTYDYYNAIREQNGKLLDKSSNSKSENLTYDQKAFYQIERYDYTIKINYVLYIVYYVFLIILIGILFFVQRNMSIYYRIILIALLVIYPFIIYTIEKILYDAGSYTYSTINTNVYYNNY